MNHEFFSATDTGRARNNNEDSIAVDEASALMVLADGMGGYNAGEVASGMATAAESPQHLPSRRPRTAKPGAGVAVPGHGEFPMAPATASLRAVSGLP